MPFVIVTVVKKRKKVRKVKRDWWITLNASKAKALVLVGAALGRLWHKCLECHVLYKRFIITTGAVMKMVDVVDLSKTSRVLCHVKTLQLVYIAYIGLSNAI